MHRLYLVLLLIGLSLRLTNVASAEDFRLTDGTVFSGDVASVNDQGLVIKLKTGGFSERVSWVKFTQDTLKVLAKNPQAAVFAEPYIEIPPEEKAKAKREAIEIKPVTRPDRPTGRVSLFAALTTPAGLMIVLVLFAANLLAAYEIAIYRNQPIALVCAVSVFVPVLGPIIFLALPTQAEHAHAAPPHPMPGDQFSAAHPTAGPEPAPAGSGSSLTSRLKNKVTSMFKPAGSGLRVAQQGKPAGAAPAIEVKVFKRGEVTFNRRFFEVQFPGLFRVVQSEAEKDLVLVVKCVRGEYVGKRISRISANEIGLQLQRGGATSEVQVPFVEIVEVQLRHKDSLQ